MLQVIIDTSSLIELALAARRKDSLQEPKIDFYKSFGGLHHAIEALVLYDQIAVDGPSIDRNSERLPELEDYLAWCIPIAVEEGAEKRIYEAVLKECVPHIEISTDHFDPFRMHTQGWMAAEAGVNHWYPSARWRDIETELTDAARASAEAMRIRFESQTPYSGAALLQLLRTLYYDRLQRAHKMDLALHPLKCTFYGGKTSSGANILEMFDSSVRKSFQERKKAWLGRRDQSAEIPMLTSYVLNRCKQWTDLPKVIQDTRNSKVAKSFRSSLNYLLEAEANHENEVVDEILAELSHANEEWSKKFKIEGPRRKIRWTVPIIGLSTEVEVPDKNLSRSHGEKLLLFIHEILASA